MQNATHGEAKELVDGTHPFAVARSEIIVHGDDVHTAAAEGVEVNRHGRDKGLAFARGHFRDLARVQGHRANQLHVKGDHVPLHRVLADDDFLAHEPATGVLHDRKRFGENFIQAGREFLVVGDLRKTRFPLGGLLAQGIVRERLQRRLDLVDLVDQRAHLFDLPVVLGADDFFYDESEHDSLLNQSRELTGTGQTRQKDSPGLRRRRDALCGRLRYVKLHFAAVPLGFICVRLNRSRTDREHRFAAVELVAGSALAAHRTRKGVCQSCAFRPCGGASGSDPERADVTADAGAVGRETPRTCAGVRGNAVLWRV